MGARGPAGRVGKRDLTPFIKLPWRLYRNEPNWVPPLVSERRQFLDRTQEPVLRARARPSTSWPGATGAPSGASRAHVDRNLNEFQDNDWGLFGFFECEDDPEAAARAARRRRGVAARARARPHGRADGLHDQRRVRRAGRGLRAPADHPHELDPPLLPGAARGRRAWRRRWTRCMWELQHPGPAREVHPAIWRMAEQVESEHGITVRPMRKKRHRGRDRPLPRGLQRRLGEELGLRRR